MQGRRKAVFFYSKYFVFLCVLPSFSFPYNCKRKQAARTQAAKQSACTTRAKAKAKRLQRHARDAKPRGKALSKHA